MTAWRAGHPPMPAAPSGKLVMSTTPEPEPRTRVAQLVEGPNDGETWEIADRTEIEVRRPVRSTPEDGLYVRTQVGYYRKASLGLVPGGYELWRFSGWRDDPPPQDPYPHLVGLTEA